jgi:hypothetical protein
MSAANASGVDGFTSKLEASSFCLTSGAVAAYVASACHLSMMARGVRAGARMPWKKAVSPSGMPTSRTVGTSGTIGVRFALVTMSARTLPSLM